MLRESKHKMEDMLYSKLFLMHVYLMTYHFKNVLERQV